MQLLPYDYFSDEPDENTGLIHLADTIDTLRSDPKVPCLLFDNGDFIQGNPLADFAATADLQNQIHPMIAAFNTLQYDAITLGNHEFNYGLAFLRDLLADATFPVTCANVTVLNDDPLAEPFLILERDLPCDDGVTRTVRVGVTGFVTPQITDWDKATLADSVTTDDIVVSAKAIVPRMKDAGADIVVALCHSGIGTVDHMDRMENAAVPLAAIPGIDVILTGHTHDSFPGDSVLPSDAVQPDKGTLHGKPAVMAGFYGKWLGVIDLQLMWDGKIWHMGQHQTQLQAGAKTQTEPSPLQQTLTSHVTPLHLAALEHIRQPIAQTAVPIHSYFASVGPDLTQWLLATAQQEFIHQALRGTRHHDLPVLSATAPFRFGGRAGSRHYIFIPPGPLRLRDAAAIYPFANTLCAIKRNGRQVKDWLERAASHFAQVTPGLHDQPLINPHSAAYNSDTIAGLTYEFDLSQPPRFNPDGTCANPDARRLRSLKHNGKPVGDDDRFLVATNSYRTNGGGGFKGIPQDDIVYNSTMPTRDVLIKYLQKNTTVTNLEPSTWEFAHLPNTSAIFHSSPAARHYLHEGVSHIGPGPDGFHRFKLTF